ncbi:NAD-dependent epimerase/dehydratase family protein [Salinibacterium sp. PAMC 21357]|uniref:NAD-dependent epimerase/dehydratase family protein n=1 Tax=Salinibacterium sp. PAMC 21357 TaxID=1112215 RepID=UPI00028A0FFD|nr:NAD-dependent epimerase/dehydratase family protein [Salinibacterium sp. PAMC 21357]
MSKTAFVLGTSGQIGAAAIPALLRDGWTVRAGSRSAHDWPDSVEGVLVDREIDESFRAALGQGVDVLVDCVAYTAAHARQIVNSADRIGSAVVISSISVYADAQGRTLDEASDEDSFPQLPLPIVESQRRTPAGPTTYSSRKVAMEDVLLNDDVRVPVSVLRPGAIYGPGSVHPRELWFIKRALDKRPVQLLNWGGHSQFHRSNTLNIAELVRLAASRPGRRALHAVDERALTTAEIADITNAYLDHHPLEFMIPGASELGDTPWSVPKPIVASTAHAEAELGYRPVASYADTVPIIVDQLVDELARGDVATAFPTFVRANGEAAFDYEAEDTWVESHRTG